MSGFPQLPQHFTESIQRHFSPSPPTPPVQMDLQIVCKLLCIQETGISCAYQPGPSKSAHRSLGSEIPHEGFYFTTLLICLYLRECISLAFTAQGSNKQNHLFKVALKSSYWQKGHHINHKIFLTLSWITQHEEENDDTIL